jgi:hypothetical protein
MSRTTDVFDAISVDIISYVCCDALAVAPHDERNDLVDRLASAQHARDQASAARDQARAECAAWKYLYEELATQFAAFVSIDPDDRPPAKPEPKPLPNNPFRDFGGDPRRIGERTSS